MGRGMTMTIDDLMEELEEMKTEYGGTCHIMAGNEQIESVEYLPPGNGYAAYINLGSHVSILRSVERRSY
jgi:hypothetical protein